MISDEERREVARKLRDVANGFATCDGCRFEKCGPCHIEKALDVVKRSKKLAGIEKLEGEESE